MVNTQMTRCFGFNRSVVFDSHSGAKAEVCVCVCVCLFCVYLFVLCDAVGEEGGADQGLGRWEGCFNCQDLGVLLILNTSHVHRRAPC